MRKLKATQFPFRTIKRQAVSADEEIFMLRIALRRAARKPKLESYNFSFWRFNSWWRRHLANEIIRLSKT